MLLLSSADIFQINVSKNSFRSTITLTMSNGLDRNQDRHSICPDLGPSCMQKLSADDKSGHLQGELNIYVFNSLAKI